jgi:hypothetical protein
MTSAEIARLARQTDFSEQQIKDYVARVAATDEIMADNIREAALFGLDIDLLGR